MEASATVLGTQYVEQTGVCITKQSQQSHRKQNINVAYKFLF